MAKQVKRIKITNQPNTGWDDVGLKVGSEHDVVEQSENVYVIKNPKGGNSHLRVGSDYCQPVEEPEAES